MEKRKFCFSSSLYAWDDFPLIAPEGNVFLINVTVTLFQFLNQTAFRNPAIPLQPENADVIAQNAQKQRLVTELPERITTFPEVTSQQRIGLRPCQVGIQIFSRQTTVSVTYVRGMFPCMPAFIV